MPRWNINPKDNCIHIMDNVIKNLKPDLRETILNNVISENITNKKDIEKYIRTELDLVSKYSRHTKQYWILRGWNEEEAYIKSKENKQKNCKSVYSRDCWLEQINPKTDTYYTIEEADFERNSRRPIRKEYWIKRGHSEAEANQLAKETKSSNNKKGAKKSAESNVRKITSKRCIDYYTVRGHSKEEAKKLVSKEQKYFSKEICIEKYGEEKGLKIWKERQVKWQKTLKSKPPEEIARINKLKLFKGGSVSKGEMQLYEQLEQQNINCKKQHAIQKNSTNFYVYDIVFENKIIEYNGDFWHASPKKYKADDVVKLPNNKTTAKEIWKKDQEKIKFAQSQGYKVLIVWESDFKENKEEVLKKCIQFLTQ